MQPCQSKGHILYVPVTEGQLSDVFQTADFTFSATVLPHDHEVQHATPEQQATFAQHQPPQLASGSPAMRKLTGSGLSSTLGDFLKTAQSTIIGLGGDVDKIVDIASLVANAALGSATVRQPTAMICLTTTMTTSLRVLGVSLTSRRCSLTALDRLAAPGSAQPQLQTSPGSAKTALPTWASPSQLGSIFRTAWCRAPHSF